MPGFSHLLRPKNVRHPDWVKLRRLIKDDTQKTCTNSLDTDMNSVGVIQIYTNV